MVDDRERNRSHSPKGLDAWRRPLCRHNLRVSVVLPGVPSFVETKLKVLKRQWSGRPFVAKEVLLNVSEERIAELLGEVSQAFPDLDFGSYPRFDSDRYRVKITVEAREAERVERGTAALLSRLDPEWIVKES